MYIFFFFKENKEWMLVVILSLSLKFVIKCKEFNKCSLVLFNLIVSCILANTLLFRLVTGAHPLWLASLHNYAKRHCLLIGLIMRFLKMFKWRYKTIWTNFIPNVHNNVFVNKFNILFSTFQSR